MATVSAEIDINAGPGEILDIIADLPTYPSWSSVHKRASIDTTFCNGRPKRATMSVSTAGLADVQVLDYVWEGNGVSWSLVKSTSQRHQQGRYAITPGSNGASHVHYELTIDPAIPVPGFLVRQVMKKAVDAATNGLKRRVESS
jgi:hypothetical protein